MPIGQRLFADRLTKGEYRVRLLLAPTGRQARPIMRVQRLGLTADSRRSGRGAGAFDDAECDTVKQAIEKAVLEQLCIDSYHKGIDVSGTEVVEVAVRRGARSSSM